VICDSGLDITPLTNSQRCNISLRRLRHSLERTKINVIVRSCRPVKHQVGPRNLGRNVFEHCKPFPDQIWLDKAETSNIPARVRGARNKALAHRIVHHRKYNGNGACRPPQRAQYRRAVPNDYIRRQAHQFRRKLTGAVKITASKSVVDPDILPLHPSPVA
jgi:hypothetical protein